MKLSLTRRGLMIVGVPLAFQLVFIGWLVSVLIDLQAELARESHSRDVIAATYAATMYMAKVIYTTQLDVSFNNKNGAMSAQTGDDQRDEIQSMWRNIQDLVKNDRSERQQVSAITYVLERSLYEFQVLRAEMIKPKPNKDYRNDAMKRFIRQGTELMQLFAQMEESEKAASASVPIKSQNLRMRIKIILASAVIVSLLLAVLCGLWYANSIKKPLKKIVDNSRLLAERKSLPPVLAGNDELSNLDRLIHNVAKAVDEAIKEEHRLIDNAADMICSLDGEGTVQSVNPVAKDMLGVDAQQLAGRSIFDFLASGEHLTADEKLRECRENEKPHTFELQLQKQKGEILDTRWSAFWSEKQASLFAIVHDDTAQKNLEKLQEDFVKMMSLDLRNPLVELRSSFIAIADGKLGDVSEEMAKDAREASRSIELLTNLVDDLLDFRNLQSSAMRLQLSEFELSEALQEARDLVNTLARAKEISVVLPDTTRRIRADRSKLRQSIVNLLSNAIKFSPKKSTIEVEVEDVGKWLELRVIDEGPGVPHEYQEKIFDEFEQVLSGGDHTSAMVSKKEGTGLGLAICKSVAEAHQGAIGMYGRRLPETGSVFWIRISTAL